jgi:hypothetical protein
MEGVESTMSEIYRFKNGSTERRYTRNEARLIVAARIVVILATSPFLFALRAIVPDVYEHLPHVPPVRLIGGGFYP